MNEKITSQLINETAIWDQVRNTVEAWLNSLLPLMKYKMRNVTCEQMDFVFSPRLRLLKRKCFSAPPQFHCHYPVWPSHLCQGPPSTPQLLRPCSEALLPLSTPLSPTEGFQASEAHKTVFNFRIISIALGWKKISVGPGAVNIISNILSLKKAFCVSKSYLQMNISKIEIGFFFWHFPGGPVAETLHSQCRVPRFDP